MRKRQIIISLLLAMSVTSCGSAAKTLTATKDVSVISTATDSLDQYWTGFRFDDAQSVCTEATEQKLKAYINILSQQSEEHASQSLLSFIKQGSKNEDVREWMVSAIRRICIESDPAERHEAIYIPVAKYLLANGDDAQRIRAEFDLARLESNPVGAVAADFSYTLPNGATAQMHDIKAKNLLLVFFDPDCENCHATIEALKGSQKLAHAIDNEVVKVLAVYALGDNELWRSRLYEIPQTWINSCDAEQIIDAETLYDITTMPVLYMLDSEKRVVLRGATVEEIDAYLEKCK